MPKAKSKYLLYRSNHFYCTELANDIRPGTQHVFCLCFNVMWWIDLWLWLRAKQTTTLSGLLQFF